MAAPAPVARTIPTGTKMPEGFTTHICLANKPGIWLWEQSVTPPEIDNGAAIKTTTQFNSVWHTYAPPRLKELKSIKATCMYDPNVFNDIINQIGSQQVITFTYPDGSSVCFYGYLMKATAKELKDGTAPTIDIEVQPTNWDPLNQVEAGPVYTSTLGT